MERRAFVIEAGKAFPVIVGALYVVGCGSSATSPSEVASISSVSTVSNAHTHTVGVPASDQMKASTTTYTSSSTSAHDHTVTLNASQLATLASGGSVTVTSSSNLVTGNHSHDFTFQGKKV